MKILKKFLKKKNFNNTMIQRYPEWNSNEPDNNETLKKLNEKFNERRLPTLNSSYLKDSFNEKKRLNKSITVSDLKNPFFIKRRFSANKKSKLLKRAEMLRRSMGLSYQFPQVAMTRPTYTREVRNDRHSKSTAPGYSRNDYGRPYDR